VAIVLLVMSVASWAVIAIKALDLLRYRKLADQAHRLWAEPDLAQALMNESGSDLQPVL